jgi:hypothetical protein
VPAVNERHPRLWVIAPARSQGEAEQAAVLARDARYNLEVEVETVAGQWRARAQFATEEHAERFEASLRPAFQAYRPLFVDDVALNLGRNVAVTVKGSIYSHHAIYTGRLERIDADLFTLDGRTVRFDQVVEVIPA